MKSNMPGSPDFGVPDPSFDVTRETWLWGITEDFDCLSAKHNVELKDKLEGLGRLGDKWDAVGEERHKPEDEQVSERPRSSSSATWPRACLRRSGLPSPSVPSTTCGWSTGAPTRHGPTRPSRSRLWPSSTGDAQARNRRSTSVKTAGCSECTQWPAPLIVTRRLRGNQRSIAATYSSRT